MANNETLRYSRLKDLYSGISKAFKEGVGPKEEENGVLKNPSTARKKCLEAYADFIGVNKDDDEILTRLEASGAGIITSMVQDFAAHFQTNPLNPELGDRLEKLNQQILSSFVPYIRHIAEKEGDKLGIELTDGEKDKAEENELVQRIYRMLVGELEAEFREELRGI